ncbi:YdcF family protein [Staphylococcus caeli]|uniref:YdcF family protein n=1 Tax=Staphylococcus caeli TaxID=2201815 RepID=UPI003F561F63
MTFVWTVIIGTLIVSLILSFVLDKSNLYKGGFINLSLFLFMFVLYILIIDINNQWLTLLFVFIAAIIILIFPLSFLLLIGSLIYLGWQLMTKEGTRLTNFLSFGLALIMISLIILNITVNSFKDAYVLLAWQWISALLIYFVLHIFAFVTTYLYLKFKKKTTPPSYIIILGSGLIHNKVPPLLQSRINKGLKLFEKYPSATVIFSGGQGKDESLAEGQAMQDYASSQNFDIHNSIVENKSLNTYENLKYSKDFFNNPKALCYIVTNNFHTLRVGQLAKQLTLNYEVFGSSVKLYFWANAIIREYIATLELHKYRHLSLLSIITLIYLAIGIIGYIFQ